MMVASGNSSLTTSSPIAFVRRNSDGLLCKVGGGFFTALSADTCMNLEDSEKMGFFLSVHDKNCATKLYNTKCQDAQQ